MMRKRILIGSCGGLTGCYLARRFHKLGLTVIGADTNSHNATRPFLDEFAVVPPASDLGFHEALANTLNQYAADYYIPTHSQEIRTVAKHEPWLRKEWGGDFLVSPYESYEKLDNKRAANEHLRLIGLPVPRLLNEPGPNVPYPIYMKPDLGSGGKQAQLVETETLHREYTRLYPDHGFYEYIQGTECTVDCMFDGNGHLMAYNQRLRLKHMGGAVIVTRNDYRFDILPYLQKLEHAFTIKGGVNFQYILANGTPYFIDVNLRLASGGLPLTVESGIDIPRILLDLWAGRSPNYVPSCGAEGKTMYRYFEEWYEMP